MLSVCNILNTFLWLVKYVHLFYLHSTLSVVLTVFGGVLLFEALHSKDFFIVCSVSCYSNGGCICSRHERDVRRPQVPGDIWSRNCISVDYTSDFHLGTFSNGKWIVTRTNGNVIDIDCVKKCVISILICKLSLKAYICIQCIFLFDKRLHF